MTGVPRAASLGVVDALQLTDRLELADGALTRDELLALVHATAHACRATGPGDVLLAAENRAGTVAAWLGAMHAGRRVTLVNPELPPDALARLHDPASAALAVGPAAWLGSASFDATLPRISLEDVESGRLGASDPSAERRVGSTILATSGTTGASKLVEWPWSALVHSARNMAMVGRYDREDVVVTSLPLFHANALLCVVLAGLLSGSVVGIDRKFSARGFSASMHRFGGTKTSLLGSMAQLVLETDVGPLAPVRRMMVAPCEGRIADELRARYGTSVAQIYGQTDICILLWNDDVAGDHDDCGLPLPGWEAAIDGDAAEGGELLVRPTEPDIATLGYVGDDDLTVRSRRDFWFHTGDRFSCADGRYTFRGRTKDVIRTRGENVSCGEVEAVLRAIDGVNDAAVVGRPNRLGEEDVIAVLESAERDLDAFRVRLGAACAQQLPPHARPTAFAIVAELPRTPTEKIAKPLIDLDQLQLVPVAP